MSDVRSFRVSVNLCLWFHDHRKRAKIFVSDNMKTIGDLERHIETIFKIKNFYLISHEEYLPPTEDVRILQKDDVVWVMQNKNEEVNTTAPVKKCHTEVIIETKKRPVSLIEDEDRPVKKKKKKKLDNEKVKTPSPFKEKHKKKKKKIEKDTVNDVLEMATDGETNSKKNKEINSFNESKEEIDMQNKNNSMNINTLLPVLQHHIKSYNQKNSNKSNKEETLSSTSLGSLTNSPISKQSDSVSELNKDNAAFYKCKGTLSSYKKKVLVPMITDKYLKEKKVNIVKIEYISGGPAATNQLELNSNENIHHEKENNSIYDKMTKDIDITADESNIVNQSLAVNENPVKLSFGKEESLNPYSKWNKKHSYSPTVNEYELSVFNEEFNKQTCRTKESSNTNPENLLQMKNPETITTNAISNSKKCPDDKTESKDMDVQDIEKITDFVNLPQTLSKKETSNIENEFISKKYATPLNNNELSLIENVKNSGPETCLTPVQMCRSAKKVDSSLKTYENDIVQVQVINTENNLQNACTKSNEKNNLSCEKEILSENVSSISKQDLSNPILIENVSSVSKQDLSNQSIMTETNLNDNIKDLELESTKEVTRSLDRLSNTSGSGHRTSSIFSRRKQLSGLGQLLEGLRSSESVATVDSMDTMDSDCSEFITKRKRKRVRRRKKKNPEVSLDTSLNDSSFPIIFDYKPKPIKTRACPTIHLKFEEEEGKPLKVVDMTKKNPGEENESYLETSGIDNVTVESDIESSKLDIKEEHILKSPSIRNLLPKLGDVIAFKILRITENYTPEISSYIIGKVNKFNADSKSVSFDILNGLEQCEDPKGKLSIEFEEHNDGHTREFVWTEIIDPRLLFP